MEDLESGSSRAGDSQSATATAAVITPPPIPVDPSDLFDAFTRSFEEVASKVDAHHRLILDLGNYYVAFLGILLAAVSGSAYFHCTTGWFLSVLCGLSSLPTITTLGFLAHGWLTMMNNLDTVLTALSQFQPPVSQEEHSPRFQPLDDARLGVYAVLKNRYSIVIGRKNSRRVRSVIVVAGALIVGAFAVSVATIPYYFICYGGVVHSNAPATGGAPPDFSVSVGSYLKETAFGWVCSGVNVWNLCI